MTRHIWLFVAAIAGLLLVVSTGGFDSTAADRGVSVEVVDDDSAFVGYDATCTEGQLDITITNRVDRPIDPEITVSGTTPHIDRIDSGGSQTVTVYDSDFEPQDAITVEISAEGLATTIHRDVPSHCEWSESNDNNG
jgi:hypothetical protein